MVLSGGQIHTHTQNGAKKMDQKIDLTRSNILGFDGWGFDENGLDENGFDESGFDKSGLDQDRGRRIDINMRKSDLINYGYDRCGYGRDGYNRAGFDGDDLNRDGISKEEIEGRNIFSERYSSYEW